MNNLARMKVLGGEIMRDRGNKDKQQELILLNGIKDREKKDKLNNNMKKMIMKREQSYLRNYLAIQVEEKKLGKYFM